MNVISHDKNGQLLVNGERALLKYIRGYDDYDGIAYDKNGKLLTKLCKYYPGPTGAVIAINVNGKTK